jgi:hypothetical protein
MKKKKNLFNNSLTLNIKLKMKLSEKEIFFSNLIYKSKTNED